MKITFTLEEQVVNEMLNLIANNSYRVAAPIINELQRQAQVQRVPGPEEDANVRTLRP